MAALTIRPLQCQTQDQAVVRVIKYVHAWCDSDVKWLKTVAAYALHCVRQGCMLTGEQVQEEARLLG